MCRWIASVILVAASFAFGAEGAGKSASDLELSCWRMMPVGAGKVEAFAKEVEVLERADGNGRWAGVYRLYLAWLRQDRAGMLAAAGAAGPEQFPYVAAESAAFKKLVGEGMTQAEAGLRILGGRSYEPLHGLLDLDRALSREGQFLRETGKEESARKLEGARDRLRQAYLACSRHVVERCFALNLLERRKESELLSQKARGIAWMNDAKSLADLLAAMDGKEAWERVISPLLRSEAAVVENPPAPAAKPARSEAMIVEAKSVTAGDGTKIYAGDARVTAGELRMACDRLAVITQGETAILSGSGNVAVTGIAGQSGAVLAQSFTFNSESGEFSFSGQVRMGGRKARLFAVDRRGRTILLRTLPDDLREGGEHEEKLRIARQILSEYSEKELSPEARYWGAMGLLRGQLTWHAPYPPAREEAKVLEKFLDAREKDSTGRWEEAHTGEEWMRAEARRQAAAADELVEEKAAPFWRLKDAGHADVAKAMALLRGVEDKELGPRARRWVEQLERNNTVVTFDVTGGYGAGVPGPVVVDVRGAEKLSFKVYRVKRAADLVAVADRIGEDFIYRDYGLQHAGQQMKMVQALAERARRVQDNNQTARLELPKFDEADVVARWESPVAQLKAVHGWRWMHRGWDMDDGDDDDWYFDDRCERFRERLEKTYRPEGKSSWQCDRIVQIPAEALKEPGAYILVGQANGQSAYAPIVVEPLSMTMRRCRDGVFVMVSDNAGKQPAGGAEIFGKEMLGRCVTDGQGAGFARVFAAGDRAIVAEKGGRFAVGGFGRVFEGIYRSAMDHDRMDRMRMQRATREVVVESAAQVYADRFVAAAYTDRPTYRPGQEVNFKLIVRKLKAQAKLGGFRDEDFEPGANLELAAAQTAVRYEVINPKGRVISTGELALNDFGTAAGKIALPTEEPAGAYSMRVRLAGADRVVPDVFAVKYYRRPNFEVKMSGVLPKLEKERELKVGISAEYYFGKAVAGAKVDVRVVRPGEWRAIADVSGALDSLGKATVELQMPEAVAGGEYFVIASVTDASQRTVSASARMEVVDPQAAARGGGGLAGLPRFARVGEELVVDAGEAVAAKQENETVTFVPREGKARVQLSKTGWHTLTSGAQQTEIFIYGPNAKLDMAQAREEDEPGRWVQLDRADDEDRWPDWLREGELLVLFDKQHVKAGQTLRLLVYVPVQKARIVFTMEGRTVIDYFSTWSEGKDGFHVVEIPIRSRHAPNFYLQGRLILGEGAEEPGERRRMREALKLKAMQMAEEGHDPRWCRVDVLAPPAPPGGQELKVEVMPERGAYEPGQDVNVAVRVTDLAGRPCEAEFSLAGVDQSVYAFGEDALEGLPRMLTARRGPTRYFEKTWKSSVGRRNYDVHMLAQQQKAMQMAQAMKMADAAKAIEALRPGELGAMPVMRIEGQRPVGSIELAALRSDFRETATWQPQIRTGADGLAAARFKLPDSLTSYRLTAVGLTRDARMGVGRASLRASKGLAVQVFLPRFAVEGDRLAATALLHNNTGDEQMCEVLWEVTGTGVEGATRQMVKVAANGSAKSELWLSMQKAGNVSVAVRAACGERSDGEKRELRVEPLGRSREVAMAGAFDKTAKLQLPGGFAASDLTITITRKDPAAAMEGLGYLIGYPYGCVEQTMSRFRPAVAVSRAAGRVKLDLPPEARAMLPEALARGLARLYNFQHADGGWGWWEKDATNDAMTLYVLEGLVRCRNAGTAVDEQVIARGCEYLKKIIGGRDAEQISRAWFILALAEKADAEALANYAAAAMKTHSAAAKCSLAMACRYTGRVDLARRLWASCAGWKPETTVMLALKLEAQMLFLDLLTECYATAYAILDRRESQRWESTQATSVAIEAMAGMLRYSNGTIHARAVRIRVGDAVALNESDAAKLGSVSYRVRLSGNQLPTVEALPVELAIDCDQPVQYAISATGTQRLDKFEETGGPVRLSREILSLDGQPIRGAVRVGQVIAVRLSLELTDAREFVLVEDRRPAGFEFADEQVAGASPSHAEFRDDRLAAFFTRLGAGRHQLTYYLRAETPGLSHMLPGAAYPMYQEKLRGETSAHLLEARP